MVFGLNGKVLRVDLSTGSVDIDELGENFYRKYLGGRGFVSYYLLKELEPKVDPLSPKNKLIFAAGLLTGVPVGGCVKNSVGAKSPLTGGYGDAEAGGYFGAELKHSGYDAIIFEGRAESPVYLWIKDGKVELRDARHLWGKTTGETQRLIHEELGDNLIRTAQIGPAGEKLVRYACILHELNYAAGRTGLGTVMGSKNLKAVAVRGHSPPPLADPMFVKGLARWLRDNVDEIVPGLRKIGTGAAMERYNAQGKLPTHNFREGSFEGINRISAKTLVDTLQIRRQSCYACPIHCKRVASVDEPYVVDPIYGAPEYEALASFGSCCGVDDLKAICKANELCNAYGVDVISAGVTIAFAMECFEKGILTKNDTGGIDLSFGNAESLIKVVKKICRREGIGDLLAEGSLRAAWKLGDGAIDCAMQVKGQEVPMHEPRYEPGLALGYAASPTGADHCHNMHDAFFAAEGPRLEEIKALGILVPVARNELSTAKVRMLSYFIVWRNVLNSLGFCQFVPFSVQQLTELTRAVTGWNTSAYELMKAGERCLSMTRAFNLREGSGKENDILPGRFFTPFASGPLQGVSIDEEHFNQARETYYSIMGWDSNTGTPTLGKLQELDIEWVHDKAIG